MIIIFKIILVILALMGIQYLAKSVSASLNKIIKSVCDNVLESNECTKEKNSACKNLVAVNDSIKLVEIIRKQTGLITKIIGLIKNVLFGALAFFVINPQDFDVNKFLTLGAYVGGWLGLKVFGNYEHWSDPVIGRATFYVYFIGSLFNIALSIFLGIGIHFIF
jgi:hypothetical protein